MSVPDSSRSSLPKTSTRPAGSFGFDIFEPDEVEADQQAILPDDFEFGPYVFGPTLGERIRASVKRSLRPLTWIVAAAAVALGSAGIVAATDHLPVTGTRPELTWATDQALSARLDAAVESLLSVSADVDVLGQMARNARGALTELNQVSLTAAQEDGDKAMASIQQRTAALDAQFGCSSWDAAREAELIKANSPELIDRYHGVCRAIAATQPLADDWQGLVDGSNVVMRVVGDINAHDVAAGEALQAAVKLRYDDALAKLDVAAASIADATSISDGLAQVTDVSTLSELLTRYARTDDALQLLWQLEKDSGGRVTPQVLAAMKVVNERKALLPTTDAFVGVVSYEMSGQITADAIGIEVARGNLEGQLSKLVGGTVFGAP